MINKNYVYMVKITKPLYHTANNDFMYTKKNKWLTNATEIKEGSIYYIYKNEGEVKNKFLVAKDENGNVAFGVSDVMLVYECEIEGYFSILEDNYNKIIIKGEENGR